jgi:arsenate reductase
VCDKAARSCPTLHPFALQTLHWPFDDPAAFRGTDDERLAKFREVRNQIDQRIRAWASELSAQERAGKWMRLEPRKGLP